MTVTDRRTGRSKGYGFVRFADEGEQMRAITEMQGVLCSTRPMRIKLATNKKPAATTQPKDSAGSMMQPANGAMPPNVMGPLPDEVHTLWIGDLEYWMDENYLQTCFSETGTI
ncbi:hypothetical protein P8452_12258 [Trifolium repens]|nr:hypothetical protein P8452_12258 [Trifolium repens]